MSEVKQVKLFVDIRFKPRLDFFSKIHVFTQDLIEKYSDWETDGLKVTLKDVKSHKLILFSHDRIVFSWEKGFDAAQVKEEITPILAGYSDLYGGLEFTWFGSRVRGYFEQHVSFDEMVKLFHYRFHSSELQKITYFGENVSDDSFVANSSLKGWDYRFELGPCKKEELIQRLQSKYCNFKEGDIPNVGIYFDVDSHRAGVVESSSTILDTGLSNVNEAIVAMQLFVSPK